ncbi:MAG: YitT family protein [Bacillota bacterium]
MNLKDKIFKEFRFFLAMVTGTAIGTFAFSRILIPNNLTAAGLGGLATVVNHISGLNIQLLLVSMAAPIVVWAIIKYDRKQVFYASFCFFLFTALIGLFEKYTPAFKTDSVIATVVAGVLSGIATGIILRQGLSNGPEAIVALYLKEKKGLSIGNFFMILNSVVVFSSIIYGNITYIIYSLISIYISGKVTDYVILGTSRNYSVNIISENYQAIREYIHHELHRGVTFVPCIGTYSATEKTMLQTVISEPDLVKLKEYTKSLNDNSFIYVNPSIEVIGKGFSEGY